MATNLPYAVRLQGTPEYREALVGLAERSGYDGVNEMVIGRLTALAVALGVNLPSRIGPTSPPASRVVESGDSSWLVMHRAGGCGEWEPLGWVEAPDEERAKAKARMEFPQYTDGPFDPVDPFRGGS